MDLELRKFEQIKATGELPSPKGVALTIIRLTQREDVGAQQLEHAIKSDPAFVGRLLKAANAAGQGTGRPIVAVADAIKVLGLAVVRNLALSFSLVSGYRKGNCTGFDFDRFWNRSLLTGLAFQEIARQVGQIAPEEAFCCGLLADVGRLALATLHPEAYGRLLAELGEDADPADVFRREEAEFLLSHDDLTAAMLTDWGLPRQLIEALYYRARADVGVAPLGGRIEKLIAAARLSDRIAEACLLESRPRAERLCALSEQIAPTLLATEQWPAVIDRVAQEWHEWGQLLQLRASSMPSCAEMVSDGVAQAAGGSDSLRVLIALGDARERAQLETLLGRLGYRTYSVGDGELALETALDVQPQILVADAAMGGIDGVRLIRTLRETKLGRAMYMVLLTGEGDDERLVEAYEAGADDYLVRPVKERVLAARLRAGARVAELQIEVERDHREMTHFAAELAVTNRRLHEASITDPLTGFYNRRYALDRLEQEWAASNRSGNPLSCMMVDLDHFKLVNDRYGHDVGDQVLSAVAASLQKNLRANDVICRMGGDEFLVISPDADAEAIRAAAARLLDAVADVLVQCPGGNVRCGVSIGVATRHAGTATLAMLMKAADEGMYRAKIGGRNRIGERAD
jgi:two-component system, cell cycle response regulator